eukprot:Lithocolla_globosa_v1_NODE_5004_length_1321_cov_1.920221.p2 type:complete len:129 gc:universal NODE_5004_length_1321_cov_1.920221:565-179(-)
MKSTMIQPQTPIQKMCFICNGMEVVILILMLRVQVGVLHVPSLLPLGEPIHVCVTSLYQPLWCILTIPPLLLYLNFEMRCSWVLLILIVSFRVRTTLRLMMKLQMYLCINYPPPVLFMIKIPFSKCQP